MNEAFWDYFKSQTETTLRSVLLKAYQDAQDLPEMMHGLMVMKAAGSFCQNFKENYPNLKAEMEKSNHSIGVTAQEFNAIIDEITSKVLREFVYIPAAYNSMYYDLDY